VVRNVHHLTSMTDVPGKVAGAGWARRPLLLPLCVCNLVLYAGLSGQVGLLPVYLARLGADPAQSGAFLACVYLCLAVSTVAAGRLAQRLARRRLLLVLSGLLAAPLAWAVGHARDVPATLLLMGSLWFVMGIAMALTSILAGLSAAAGRRGRRFGALQLASASGLLTGGLVSGPLVEHASFAGLFAAFGWAYLLIPVAGLLLDEPRPDASHAERRGAAARDPSSGRLDHPRESEPRRPGQSTLVVLLVASVLAQAANITLFFSRTLMMNGRGYQPTAISTAAAIGSALTLPLPLVLGWLSDRLGRKPLLLACFAAPVLGLLVQLSAVALWQFWLASALSTVLGASVVVAAALVGDLFPARLLSTPLALLNATPWAGIVLGLTASGAVMRTVQMTPALTLAVLTGLAALLLLLRLPSDSGPGRLRS